MRKLLFILAAVLYSQSVFAGACQNSGTPSDFNACSFGYKEKAFKSLAKTYDAAVKLMQQSEFSDEEERSAEYYLVESQKIWWKMKDVECQNPAWNFGSTGLGSVYICQAEKALLREKELSKIYLNK